MSILTQQQRKAVYKRCGGKCIYCGKPLVIGIQFGESGERIYPDNLMIADHKQPRSRGGKNNTDNMVASCYACNFEKSDKYSFEEFVSIKKGNRNEY